MSDNKDWRKRAEYFQVQNKLARAELRTLQTAYGSLLSRIEFAEREAVQSLVNEHRRLEAFLRSEGYERHETDNTWIKKEN